VSPDRRAPLAAVVLSAGCALDPATLRDDIAEVHAPCDAEALARRTAGSGLQALFEPCGSNQFLHHAWSPSGLRLYYQTPSGPWLLDAATRRLQPLPIGFPIGAAAWFDDEHLVFPERARTGFDVAEYDVRRNTFSVTQIGLHDLGSLHRGEGPDEVLLLAAPGPGEVRVPTRLHARSGRSRPAFPWLDDEVDDFTYRASQRLVALRPRGADHVRVHDAETGAERHRFEGASRASVSSDGRFVVIEGPGETRPAFPPSAGPGLARFPTMAGRASVTPPQLSVFDTRTGQRVELEGVHGTSFTWYDARDYFGTFVLWGLDEEETNRNLVLVHLDPWLARAGVVDLPAARGSPRRGGTGDP